MGTRWTSSRVIPSLSSRPSSMSSVSWSPAWACRCRTSSSTGTSSSSRWWPSPRSRERSRVPVRVARAHRGHPVHPVGPRGRQEGPQRPSQPRRAGGRALPPGGHLLPRRGRPRRRAGRAPGRVHAVRRARRRVPAPEVLAQRRGAGLGPAAGPALRLRRPLRRPQLPPERATAQPELVLHAAGGQGAAARSWWSWSARSTPPTARR